MQRDSYFKAFDNTLSIKVRIAFTLSLCVDEYFMHEEIDKIDTKS